MATRPTQHPASNSDARKRAAENLATPDWGSDLREPDRRDPGVLTDTERCALAAAACGNCGERTAVLNLVKRVVAAHVTDALDERYVESDHKAAKFWRAKREAEARAEKAEAERDAAREALARVRDDIRARRREFRRLDADERYLLALDDAYGIAANACRAALAQPATNEGAGA